MRRKGGAGEPGLQETIYSAFVSLKKNKQLQMMNAADFLSFRVIHTPQETIKHREEFLP